MTERILHPYMEDARIKKSKVLEKLGQAPPPQYPNLAEDE
jgi:hypothetical protein